MNIQHGLLQTKVTSEEQSCQEKNCSRPMTKGMDCFVDIHHNTFLCEECGKCKRYERKKTQERKNAGILEVPLIKGLDY